MARMIRRILPITALCLATLLGGCVYAPEWGGGGYHHGWWGHGGWGWHR